jgi:hypothetical protein
MIIRSGFVDYKVNYSVLIILFVVPVRFRGKICTPLSRSIPRNGDVPVFLCAKLFRFIEQANGLI